MLEEEEEGIVALMFMREEAIVIKRVPFEEGSCLIDLFGEKNGLIKIFTKDQSPLHPFSLVDCVLQKGRSELFYIKEAHVLALLPEKRTPDTLFLAAQLSDAMSHISRDADVYALYKAFMSHLHLANRPKNWVASFLLKLLSHEGLLSLKPGNRATIFDAGEWHEKGPAWGLAFAEEEINTLLFLAKSRSLFEIDEKNVSETLVMKINQMFENAKGGT